ncbi:hypothetical protein CASFOL_012635 [Castilleja foliolosa]|uniref:Uncharacterized protein n=1 Tax=Castilleja foliolosa TaxID=1961234 RepID=A0ABD3DHM1_9LAMI
MPKRTQEVCQANKVAPRGHFVVYVGKEMARFVVPLRFLKNPLFQHFLDKAAEEHGFHDTYRITLACDVAVFQRLVAVLSHDDQ